MHSVSAGEIMTATNLEKLKYFGSSLEDADDWNQFRNGNLVFSMLLCRTQSKIQDFLLIGWFLFRSFKAVRATIRETPPPPVR